MHNLPTQGASGVPSSLGYPVTNVKMECRVKNNAISMCVRRRYKPINFLVNLMWIYITSRLKVVCVHNLECLRGVVIGYGQLIPWL